MCKLHRRREGRPLPHRHRADSPRPLPHLWDRRGDRLDEDAPVALSRRRPRPRRLRRGRRRPTRQLCPRRPPAARARMGRARLAAASARQLGARFLAGGGCGRGRVGHRSQPRGRVRVPPLPRVGAADRRVFPGQPPPLRRRRFHAAPRRRRRGPRAGGRRVQRDGACRRGVATKPGPGLPRRQLRRAAVPSSGRVRRDVLGYERQREHRPGVAGDRRQAEAAGESGPGEVRPRLSLGLRGHLSSVGVVQRRHHPLWRGRGRVRRAAVSGAGGPLVSRAPHSPP
mmetsp:Transcript_39907/g.131999  ORF Transcript_39907/g.131999 Transcript_39907/m.131999 type:complete len:284 (+) Transcript_39907:660-1511(+)